MNRVVWRPFFGSPDPSIEASIGVGNDGFQHDLVLNLLESHHFRHRGPFIWYYRVDFLMSFMHDLVLNLLESHAVQGAL